MFYSCTNYPKCDFTANNKPVPGPCPECGSAYLMEKTLKSGVYLVCPNNPKKSAMAEAAAAAEKPAKKGKKKAAEPLDPDAPIVCHFTKRIGDAPEKLPAIVPVVHGVVEQEQPVA
jgi:DNA topoisomerase-1